MKSVSVQCRGIGLSYGDTEVLKGVDLDIAPGEFFALLGPSGSGKSTLLRLIAGFVRHQRGELLVDGQDLTALEPWERQVGLVFQNYALWPHLTVWDNVAFGLVERRVPKETIREKVGAALELVGLSAYGERRPGQLSGGQQQRVALARAIVLRPRLLLLDEPLSNLDARLRLEMRAELRRLQRQIGVTMLYVTHDQEEALSLSDRIVVMRDGRIEQDATPDIVFHRPATAFVASFMGWSNLWPWRDGALLGEQGRWPLALPRPAAHVAWRPQMLTVMAAGTADALPGQVLARSYLGERNEYLLRTPIGDARACAALDAPWREGDAVAVRLDAATAALIS